MALAAPDRTRPCAAIRADELGIPSTSMQRYSPWPIESSPSDDDLVAEPHWGQLISRWHYTVRCFIHPVSFDEPDIADYWAHRIVLLAALQYRVDDSVDSFEAAIRSEIVNYVVEGMPKALKVAADRDPDRRAGIKAFLSLSQRDQLVVLLYDADDGEGSRSSRHEYGKFRPKDLARLLGVNEGALRTAASRATTRFRSAVAASAGRPW